MPKIKESYLTYWICYFGWHQLTYNVITNYRLGKRLSYHYALSGQVYCGNFT
ncbi:hypothetical protein [Mucilaginibacter sp. OK098]|uniref:hypothetical protein n=1 Tax=Mucilaginibacter sp. OK098 TaxID=1855297 RepID=UPI00091633EC|nr:hypothetical protein [Mucilaginibacter sp. OK098]SHM77935.1 hypothetical protein SAMN05216524_103377 [Mucilaginibacter sp. OK098]